ncbi:NifB/NifX family molybdenum-iron cluster-binding protein [Martelella endophytica]|uniref:Dinitrogenase iron-molybdenum cofactor biosynthesis protein n=1 Tax=Martelella endophytica TaxID=1486262 RepID=A0A0D5LTR9_MAREN|nr:NifB/NifX family molybdenum-iron cluster-binding protein [Martelella endophytica]AJY46773.1 hypothetical protein TM49_15615 [Martelella endophytica]
MNTTLDRNLALKVGLAARQLPDIGIATLLSVLDKAVSLPLTEEKLQGLTMKAFRSAGGQEFLAIPGDRQKAAFACLKEPVASGADDPIIETYHDGDMRASLRIACGSNGAERLDGHFGSCSRFLIYQVSATECRLIDVRRTDGERDAEDKNVWRAGLISDCQVLHVLAIGGPAAAKVVRANILPLKHAAPIAARDVMAGMQKVIAGTPPPWLARAMGREAETLKGFLEEVAT